MKNKIKFIVMDVDGTLTDGKVYMGASEELFKAFDIKDGYAIARILPQKDIIPIVITARNSRMLKQRCDELNIKECWQGQMNKLDKLNQILESYSTEYCKYTLESVAYIGDDLIDLPCMEAVKKGNGIVGCPADAVEKVRQTADYISRFPGGCGAVRDFIEWIVKETDEGDVQNRIDFAISYLSKRNLSREENGFYQVNDYFSYTVKDYMTLSFEDACAESHANHADVQWIVKGTAKYCFQNCGCSIPVGLYDAQKDVQLWEKSIPSMEMILKENGYTVIYPQQIHIPCIAVEQPECIKIVVGKVNVGNIR